jgi:hypothetical protein
MVIRRVCEEALVATAGATTTRAISTSCDRRRQRRRSGRALAALLCAATLVVTLTASCAGTGSGAGGSAGTGGGTGGSANTGGATVSSSSTGTACKHDGEPCSSQSECCDPFGTCEGVCVDCSQRFFYWTCACDGVSLGGFDDCSPGQGCGPSADGGSPDDAAVSDGGPGPVCECIQKSYETPCP